jgi:mannose-6-phosphate isomerase-like protein (cupin superfamily)
MDSIRVGADELQFQVTSDALLAVEVRMPPGGGPPGLHRHAPHELYRGVAGEFTIHFEDEQVTLRPGEVVHIPGGAAHTVRNETGEEARAFVVFSPGAEMERFVRAAADLVAPDKDTVRALAERHGIEFV